MEAKVAEVTVVHRNNGGNAFGYGSGGGGGAGRGSDPVFQGGKGSVVLLKDINQY